MTAHQFTIAYKILLLHRENKGHISWDVTIDYDDNSYFISDQLDDGDKYRALLPIKKYLLNHDIIENINDDETNLMVDIEEIDKAGGIKEYINKIEKEKSGSYLVNTGTIIGSNLVTGSGNQSSLDFNKPLIPDQSSNTPTKKRKIDSADTVKIIAGIITIVLAIGKGCGYF